MVPIFDMVKNIPGRQSAATYEIIFRAENLPPVGFKRYNLVKISSTMQANPNKRQTTKVKIH